MELVASQDCDRWQTEMGDRTAHADPRAKLPVGHAANFAAVFYLPYCCFGLTLAGYSAADDTTKRYDTGFC